MGSPRRTATTATASAPTSATAIHKRNQRDFFISGEHCGESSVRTQSRSLVQSCRRLRIGGFNGNLLFSKTIVAGHSGRLHAVPVAEVHSRRAVPFFSSSWHRRRNESWHVDRWGRLSRPECRHPRRGTQRYFSLPG